MKRTLQSGVSTSLLAAAAASIFLLVAGAAQAADDRFDPSKFDGLGGFKPVTHEGYRKECGACHFAYLPGLLPGRSWSALLDNLASHFGENIALPAEQVASLREYLVANAMDKAPEMGPALLRQRVDDNKTPLRVTQMPLISRQHIVVREVLRTNTGASRQVRNITNCDSCHTKAAEGSFALHDTIVPGVTKIVRPGGQF